MSEADISGVFNPLDVSAAIAVGIIIGILSGLVTILIVRVTLKDDRSTGDFVELIAEFVAVPSLWFGGGFINEQLVVQMKLAQNVSYYMLSVAIVYSCLVLFSTAPYLRLFISSMLPSERDS